MRGRVAAGQDDADVRIGTVWGRMGGSFRTVVRVFCFLRLAGGGMVSCPVCLRKRVFPVFDGMRKGCGMGRDVYGFAEMASAGWDRKVLREADAGCRMPDVGWRMSDGGCRMSDGGVFGRGCAGRPDRVGSGRGGGGVLTPWPSPRLRKGVSCEARDWPVSGGDGPISPLHNRSR